MTRGGFALVALGISVVGGVILAGACDDQARSHIFVAREYLPIQGCVTLSEGIDVVDGPGPSGPACPPVCILDTTGDVFVSGMCPPYPYLDIIEAPDGGPDGSPMVALGPLCAAALAVYNCNITCGDAGIDAGIIPMDAAACIAHAEEDGSRPTSEAGDSASEAADGSSAADGADGE
jgi:hypothetical protein